MIDNQLCWNTATCTSFKPLEGAKIEEHDQTQNRFKFGIMNDKNTASRRV